MLQFPVKISEKFQLNTSWNNDKIMLGHLKNGEKVTEIRNMEECKWQRS